MTFIIHKYSGFPKVQKRASTGRPENTFHQTRVLMLVRVVIDLIKYIFNLQLCDIEYQLTDHKIMYFSVI